MHLIERAAQFQHRAAIISNQKTYTYQELDETSAKIGSYLLQNQSDLKEARVAFMITPSFEYVATQWGIWRAGGIAVPLCTTHPLPALQYTLEDSDADFLIVTDVYREKLVPLAKDLGIPLIHYSEAHTYQKQILPEVSPERRAMILYTSGTTSKPKGVVTSHQAIESQITTLVKAWEWEQDDHILNILPLHHVHGIINVLSCAMWSGAVCEFLPKFNAEKVWNKFLEGNLNLFMAVPTIYYKLIAYWKDANKETQEKMSSSLQAFRLMVSGSAALPVSVLDHWREISTHTLLERYGMTEIGMGLSNPYNGERRPGHVGQPLPGVTLRLVNDMGQEVDKGSQGEIQIKSPSLFMEYWRKEAATKDAFQDGWFRTGDIAIFNDGSYKILGRNSVDIIKSGGYKISALQIEEVLRTHPQIKECAVVGIPSEEWGEIVAAGIVSDNPGMAISDLQSWAREHLPPYQVPRKILFLDDLPRNTLGKVTKNILKGLFEE